jgi:hypothetical protein
MILLFLILCPPLQQPTPPLTLRLRQPNPCVTSVTANSASDVPYIIGTMFKVRSNITETDKD